MRVLFTIVIGVLTYSFCKSPSIEHFTKQFPELMINGDSAVHFGPDDFHRELWNAEQIRFYDIVLQNGTSCTPSHVAENGEFIEPRCKLHIGGRQCFIVHRGDTSHVWIYTGKETILYMANPVTDKFEPKYTLASGHAGEGPWYETDSWITDLNKDGNMDILSREIGEWITQDTMGLYIDNSRDDLRAVTWRDTGFVEMKLKNVDSLKKIYVPHYYRKPY